MGLRYQKNSSHNLDPYRQQQTAMMKNEKTVHRYVRKATPYLEMLNKAEYDNDDILNEVTDNNLV